MEQGLQTRYFLSAETGAGFCSFVSHFLRQPGRYVHILKGGPGCGKSTFLKRLSARAAELGLETELLHCAGDPDALDGLYLPEANVAWLDGTAPHACDPVSFGATGDYIDLGAFCDTRMLDARRVQLLEESRALFMRRAREYLTAAAALDPCGTPGLRTPEDISAVQRRAAGAALREFGAVRRGDAPGRVERRFLAAVTGAGRICFDETVVALSDRVYLLDNVCGLAEDYLRTVGAHALGRGLACVVCPDPLRPARTQALLVPARRVAFLVADGTELPGLARRHIRLDTVPEAARLRALRPTLRADRKLQRQALDASVRQLQMARLLHDEIEAVYRPCVDFAALTDFTERSLQAFPSAPSPRTARDRCAQ